MRTSEKSTRDVLETIKTRRKWKHPTVITLNDGFLKDAAGFRPRSNFHIGVSPHGSLLNWTVRGTWRFLHANVIFFHLARTSAFDEVPYPRLRCRNPKLCLISF